MGFFMNIDGIPMDLISFLVIKINIQYLSHFSKIIQDFHCNEFIFCVNSCLSSTKNCHFNHFGINGIRRIVIPQLYIFSKILFYESIVYQYLRKLSFEKMGFYRRINYILTFIAVPWNMSNIHFGIAECSIKPNFFITFKRFRHDTHNIILIIQMVGNTIQGIRKICLFKI